MRNLQLNKLSIPKESKETDLLIYRKRMYKNSDRAEGEIKHKIEKP